MNSFDAAVALAVDCSGVIGEGTFSGRIFKITADNYPDGLSAEVFTEATFGSAFENTIKFWEPVAAFVEDDLPEAVFALLALRRLNYFKVAKGSAISRADRFAKDHDAARGGTAS